MECILCAVTLGSRKVKNLKVLETDRFVVSLNLYPYNPGHLILFPRRHVRKASDLTPAEAREVIPLVARCQEVLEKLYTPAGFNVGWNEGTGSGGSIDHLHLHVVPRYANEIGIVDILSGTRVIVEDPIVTRRKIRKAFAKGPL